MHSHDPVMLSFLKVLESNNNTDSIPFSFCSGERVGWLLGYAGVELRMHVTVLQEKACFSLEWLHVYLSARDLYV